MENFLLPELDANDAPNLARESDARTKVSEGIGEEERKKSNIQPLQGPRPQG